MNSESNLIYVTGVKKQFQLTNLELAKLAEYSESYVKAWFSRKRPVPSRAVTILKANLKGRMGSPT